MLPRRAATIRRVRIASQTVFLGLFLLCLPRSGAPVMSTAEARGPFFALDPLLLVSHLAATGKVLAFALPGLGMLALTLVLGRVFCGWVCPLGAVHQAATWFFRSARKASTPLSHDLLRMKYLVLVALVAATLAGSSVLGWLDPLALLSRSIGAALTPAAQHLAARPAALAGPPRPAAVGERGRSFDRRKRGEEPAPRGVSSQPALIGGLFLLLVGLNAWRPRFFCNVLCPLGALHGLVGSRSFLRFWASSSCTACGVCGRRCPYGGDPGRRFRPSECLTCFSCAADCPQGQVEVSLARPADTRREALDLGRRRLLGATAAGVASASLAAVGIGSRPSDFRDHIRPPGAVEEQEFLARCLRCGECVQSCPTGFIQPAGLEAGLQRLWTPIGDARAGYCEWACTRCTAVCPSRAIEPLTLARKQKLKIGTALVDRSRCYTHADGFECTVCADRCPVPEKAIRFRPVDLVDYRGKAVRIRQIYVVPELCTGCGICQHVCPRGDAPGIVITAEDETREGAIG